LYLRLEGGEGSVASAHERLGGERIEGGFWARLRERQLPFFDQPGALWRLSLPFNVGPLELPGAQLLDWAGAQRWLISTADPATIRAAVSTVGGHATCFTPGHSDSPFQPLPAALLRYHRQLKQQLDPHGIFNPGHLYREV
jgi:glycolate oxidase FAD binding subunit